MLISTSQSQPYGASVMYTRLKTPRPCRERGGVWLSKQVWTHFYMRWIWRLPSNALTGYIDCVPTTTQKKNEGVFASDADKVAELIPAMLAQAIDATNSGATPTTHQVKIQHYVSGVDIPIIGYIDYRYPNHVIDLKTTERLPSKPRPDHARQVAIYSAATGCAPQLLYVTHRKHALYEIDPAPHLADVERAAKAIQHLLTLCKAKSDITTLFVPQYDNFRWSGALATEARRIWK